MSSHRPSLTDRSVEMGAVPGTRPLTLQVELPLRDTDVLDAALEHLYNPQSPAFHRFFTPNSFAAAFHPTADAVQQVQQALSAAGMVVTSQHGAFLQVEADAETAQRVFQTELKDYMAPNGEIFQAPTADVRAPAGLPVVAVHGLTAGLWHHGHRVPVPLRQGGPAGLNPNAIRQAYNIPSALTGSGQSVGLFEFDGYAASDIQGYEKAYSLPQATLTNIAIDNFNGQPGQAADEVTLDIEMVLAMAPAVDEVRVYEIAGSGSDVDLLNEVANPSQGDKKLIPIISCSFGNAEDLVSPANLEADNSLLKQMAAQGQTFFDAAGDSGAMDDGTRLSVDQYAGQPYVVGVGGTTLHLNNGAYGSESTWSGGGGGVSAQWPIPTWQANAVNTASKGSPSMRNVPDVSLDADPNTGYEMFFQGTLMYGGGGTSFASPLWAAFMALANEQRASKGLGPLGFLSPALYSVGQTSAYATVMHDIADNSTNGFFPAVPNLDNATGWGTLNGAQLVSVLSQGQPPSNASPANPAGQPPPASTDVANVSTAAGCSVSGAEPWLLVAAVVSALVRRRRQSRIP